MTYITANYPPVCVLTHVDRLGCAGRPWGAPAVFFKLLLLCFFQPHGSPQTNSPFRTWANVRIDATMPMVFEVFRIRHPETMLNPAVSRVHTRHVTQGSA